MVRIHPPEPKNYLYMFFIAPPFGNYLRFKNALSVTGSWTFEPRPGLWKQVIKTLRPTTNGWRNKIGLRNKGIEHGKLVTSYDNILSLAAISEWDWINLESAISPLRNVEINISCPNVETLNPHKMKGFDLFPNDKRKWCIAKVPPTISEYDIDSIIDSGFTQIHACNTLPTDKGGLSGRILVPHTLRIIDYIKSSYDNIEIIAGGGVTKDWHAQYYLDAGADHISIGTACFKPWKIKKIINNTTFTKP